MTFVTSSELGIRAKRMLKQTERTSLHVLVFTHKKGSHDAHLTFRTRILNLMEIMYFFSACCQTS